MANEAREDLKRYLPTPLLQKAGEFTNSTLWTAFRDAMIRRAPPPAAVEDIPTMAAAKAFKRDGWLEAINEMEQLPFDVPEEPAPMIPPSLTDPAD